MADGYPDECVRSSCVDEVLINGALAIDAISSENLTMEAVGYYRTWKSEQYLAVKSVD